GRSNRGRHAPWGLPERERLERGDRQLAAVLALVERQTPESATVWCVGPSAADHFALIGALQILLWPRWFFSVDALPPELPTFAGGRETFLLAEPPLPEAWRRAGERVGAAQGRRLWRLNSDTER
ncbi:MAG: hypothetical protein AAFZ65_14915, partial [Planctomycetota bacterium]